jgi:hypothetical protein
MKVPPQLVVPDDGFSDVEKEERSEIPLILSSYNTTWKRKLN